MKILAVDIGNTKIKAGVFSNLTLLKKFEILNEDKEEICAIFDAFEIERLIISNVSGDDSVMKLIPGNIPIFTLNSSVKLPFKNFYKSKLSLGVDRIAMVAGAQHFFPDKNCLIIDAGTCVTYDILNSNGAYLGGNITPGLQMRLKAMNKFTGKLPFPKWKNPAHILGKDTENCMLSGAYFGLIGEIQYFKNEYEKEFPHLNVLISGGDATLLAKPFKNSIFVHEHLLLYGLIKILTINVY